MKFKVGEFILYQNALARVESYNESTKLCVLEELIVYEEFNSTIPIYTSYTIDSVNKSAISLNCLLMQGVIFENGKMISDYDRLEKYWKNK